MPDNWWERPAAPVFHLGLASSRPKSGQWTLQIQLDQVDGGDIGKPRFAYRRGKDVTQPEAPTLRSRRKWRLSDLTFVPEGVPLELILTFWWDGAERTVTYHWDKEVQFQTADTQIRYSWSLCCDARRTP